MCGTASNYVYCNIILLVLYNNLSPFTQDSQGLMKHGALSYSIFIKRVPAFRSHLQPLSQRIEDAVMGVPKFFRWMSERYPAISQLIAENRIPEFDCLYLDMSSDLTLLFVVDSWLTVDRRHHPQLHTQRFGLTYIPDDRRQDVHCHFQLYRTSLWQDQAPEAILHGYRWSCAARKDEPATSETVQDSTRCRKGKREGDPRWCRNAYRGSL